MIRLFREVCPHAAAALAAGLRHVVVTSVARDDLPDEGAGHFKAVVDAIRAISKDTTVEILTPDFHARRDCLETIAEADVNQERNLERFVSVRDAFLVSIQNLAPSVADEDERELLLRLAERIPSDPETDLGTVAPDRAARPRRPHRQATHAAGLAKPWVRAIAGIGEEVRS